MPFIGFVLNFFRRRRKVRVIHRDVCRISPEDWRADPEMVKLAQHVLNDPRFKLMLDCVYFAHPATVLVGMVHPEQAAFLHAQGQGYTMALNSLRELGISNRLAEPLGDPTFEPPEELAQPTPE